MANIYIRVKNIKVHPLKFLLKNHETYFIPYIRLFRYHPNIINALMQSVVQSTEKFYIQSLLSTKFIIV